MCIRDSQRAVLDHLAEQGIDTKPYTDRLGRLLSMTLGDSPKWFPPAMKRWWLYRRLADVAALEHYTAMLGQWVLTNRGLDYAKADPMMLDLLRWHGAEEVEHRSLVYDVYQHVSGNYLIRAFSMLFVSPLFIGWWVAGARYLMAQDPTNDRKWRWRDWLWAAREYRLPGPWKLMVTTPVRYMRPSHHPNDEADTQMAIDYLAYSPVAKAAQERARSKGKSPDQAQGIETSGNGARKAKVR
ncbi:metal-dependent hydrolase, partial [Mycobacterium sp. 852002-30065_SCH5024008]|uniref:metal-dependent hydrolase n=1 Tax=Mycobacterium sp. 852002-30065_SCH5024008 TaxID=1834088 RepID=UPI0008003154